VCASLLEKLFFLFSDILIEQVISVSVDGLIWTFSEHSIDHTVQKSKERKMWIMLT